MVPSQRAVQSVVVGEKSESDKRERIAVLEESRGEMERATGCGGR